VSQHEWRIGCGTKGAKQKYVKGKGQLRIPRVRIDDDVKMDLKVIGL